MKKYWICLALLSLLVIACEEQINIDKYSDIYGTWSLDNAGYTWDAEESAMNYPDEFYLNVEIDRKESVRGKFPRFILTLNEDLTYDVLIDINLDATKFYYDMGIMPPIKNYYRAETGTYSYGKMEQFTYHSNGELIFTPFDKDSGWSCKYYFSNTSNAEVGGVGVLWLTDVVADAGVFYRVAMEPTLK